MKKSKLDRSQTAHNRLWRVAHKKYQETKDLNYLVKSNYHFYVKEDQEYRGVILSRKEKQKIFNNEKRYVFTYLKNKK